MTDLPLLIIGIGNRYRSDDAFGCLVVEELKTQMPPEIDCIEHDGDAAGLIDCWQEAGRVIIIDAVSSGREPGTIFQFDLMKETLPEEFHLYSTHAFGIPQAVEMARVLGKLPYELTFLGVEGEWFGAGSELSPQVIGAKSEIIDIVLRKVSWK